MLAILENDKRWDNVLAFSEFSGRILKRQPPPLHDGEAGEWTDADDAELEQWLAVNYGLRGLRSVDLPKAVLLAARRHRFHEVRDYLDSLTWDKAERLRHWLHMFLGAPDTPYVEAVSVKWMVAAVARVFRVPVKVDNVLILEGTQGIYKSTALKVLGGPWFTDQGFRFGDKDAVQLINGRWVVELAELDGLNKADSAAAKAFFARDTDRIRPPYGRNMIDFPRQCVFAGTVNHATYLRDETGNRRYWPITVTQVDIEGLRRERDQLWAEAKALFDAGTEWWVRAGERELFELEQDQRYVGDAYEEKLRAWLIAHPEVTDINSMKLMGEALGLEASKWTPPEQQRVGRIMHRIGWPRVKVGSRASREWVYKRPDGWPHSDEQDKGSST